jgi:hypothetical protein
MMTNNRATCCHPFFVFSAIVKEDNACCPLEALR